MADGVAPRFSGKDFGFLGSKDEIFECSKVDGKFRCDKLRSCSGGKGLRTTWNF